MHAQQCNTLCLSQLLQLMSCMLAGSCMDQIGQEAVAHDIHTATAEPRWYSSELKSSMPVPTGGDEGTDSAGGGSY